MTKEEITAKMEELSNQFNETIKQATKLKEEFDTQMLALRDTQSVLKGKYSVYQEMLDGCGEDEAVDYEINTVTYANDDDGSEPIA